MGEGWVSETREDFEGFLSYDPDGCFVGEEDGGSIGIGVAVRYGEFGFIGEFVVVKEMRGRGVGRQLIQRAIEYLRGRGVENVLLDAAPAAIPLYERIGFRKACRSLRFTGSVCCRSHPGVRDMQIEDLDAVSEMDRDAFGGDRRFFLERRLSLYPELCKVCECAGDIGGFIMGRRRGGVVWVGPWVVRGDVEHPAHLLEGLRGEGDTFDVRLGVLETSSEAVRMMRGLGFSERSQTPWRMALGSSGHLGLSSQVYAIGSGAKG